MKKSKKHIETPKDIFCLDKTEACEKRNSLANIFPYHRPNCLTKDQFEIIESDESTQEELAEVYAVVFNSDVSYSEKRFKQLKRIAQEYK